MCIIDPNELIIKGEILYQDFVSKHLAILPDVRCFIASYTAVIVK